MSNLVVVGLAGFAASMVDGALGMGFGPTSSSILLSSGMSPAAISTTVNIAKVATGTAAGVAHWRFGNINRKLVLQLAIPGALGAIVGTTVLANVDGKQIKPYLAVMLLLVGLRILFRFRSMPSRKVGEKVEEVTDYDTRGVAVAGAAGGITNGLVGAWGPVVTPFLLHRRVPPRITVGSVNTAEVAVAAVAVGSLFASLGRGGVDMGVVLAMLIGGVLAAPIAAWVIRFLPARGMGVAVSGLLLTTNVQQLATWAQLGSTRWIAYGAVAGLVGWSGVHPWLNRHETAIPDVVETTASVSTTQAA